METKDVPDAVAGNGSPRVDSRKDNPLPYISEALRGLLFGTVTVIVQNGVVVQIERTEKRRFQHSVRTG